MTIDNLSVDFGDVRAINRLSLTLPDRGVIALSGPSGCGKSTLLHTIAGLISPSEGRADVKGRVSMVFQEDRLLNWLTVYQNVSIVTDTVQDRTSHWLKELELFNVDKQYPNSLSGGMSRRVSLARALNFPADIYLLDEPFKGLDDSLISRIAPRIFHALSGKLTLLVSHDQALVKRVSTAAYVFSGPPLTFLSAE